MPLFATLSAGIKAPKALFARSRHALSLPGISVARFDTPRRTNWQYDCVNAFLRGRLELPWSLAVGPPR